MFIIDGSNADVLLGTLDSAFLFAYAAGMFIRFVFTLENMK